MSALLSTLANPLLTTKKNIDSEEELKPLKHVVSFDPNYMTSDNKKYYEPLFGVMNKIIEEDTGAPVLFDQPSGEKTSDYFIDKTKSSKELDRYNGIRSEIEEEANKNTLWENKVVQRDKDRLIDYWTDTVYGFTKHAKEKFPNNLSQKAEEDLTSIGDAYLSHINDQIRSNTQKQYKEYNDSDFGFKKSAYDAVANTLGGVSAKARDLKLEIGLNTEFGEQGEIAKQFKDWSDNWREDAEKAGAATGLNAVPLVDIIRDKNTDVGDVLSAVAVKAVQSFPSLVPTAIGTLSVLNAPGLARKVLGGAVGLLGSNFLMTGAEAEEYKIELQRLASEARKFKPQLGEGMSEKEYESRYQIKFGDYSKPVDEYSDDELRQMAESYAVRYANFATVIELASLGVVGNMGKIANGLSSHFKTAPPIKLATRGFMKHGIKSVGLGVDEALEEVLQGTTSDFLKSRNLPNTEFELFTDERFEEAVLGFALGSVLGLGQSAYEGSGYISSEMSQSTQEDIQQVILPTKKEASIVKEIDGKLIAKGGIDDALIVGLYTDNETLVSNVATAWGISEEKVEARLYAILRSKDINDSELAAKAILKANPELAKVFPETQEKGYRYDWDDKKKQVVKGKPVTKNDVDIISQEENLTDIERNALNEFVEPLMPEDDSFYEEGHPSSAGQSFVEFLDDPAILQLDLENYKIEKQDLINKKTSVNTFNTEERIKILDQKIADTLSVLKGGSKTIEKKTQKKIEKNVEAKKKTKDRVYKSLMPVIEKMGFKLNINGKNSTLTKNGKNVPITNKEKNQLRGYFKNFDSNPKFAKKAIENMLINIDSKNKQKPLSKRSDSKPYDEKGVDALLEKLRKRDSSIKDRIEKRNKQNKLTGEITGYQEIELGEELNEPDSEDRVFSISGIPLNDIFIPLKQILNKKGLGFTLTLNEKQSTLTKNGKNVLFTVDEKRQLKKYLSDLETEMKTGDPWGDMEVATKSIQNLLSNIDNKEKKPKKLNEPDVNITQAQKDFEESDEFKNAPSFDPVALKKQQGAKPKLEKKIVKRGLKNANGEAYNQISLEKPDDIKLFSVEGKSQPTVEIKNPKLRKKIDKVYNDLWEDTKEQWKLDDTHFRWWVENVEPYANRTTMAHEFNRWSRQWMHDRPLFSKFKDFAYGLKGKESLESEINMDEFLLQSEEKMEGLPNYDSIKDSGLSTKDTGKIAKTFWTKYEFKIDPVLFRKVQLQAMKVLNDENLNDDAFNNFVKIISRQRLITNSDGYTVESLINRDPRARETFKKYWTMMLPENLGTTHLGIDGNTVHYEARMEPFADTSKEGVKRFTGLRPTSLKDMSLTRNKRPETETQKMYNRFNYKGYKISYLYKKNIIINDRKDNPYGAFDQKTILELQKDQLIPKGLVLIGTRGEKSTFIMVNLTQDNIRKGKNMNEFASYLRAEYSLYKNDNSISDDQMKLVETHLNGVGSPSQMSESEKEFSEYLYNDGQGEIDLPNYRAHWMTRHDFLKDVLGKEYIFDSPENISKRIKIPFTPVFTSPTLPDRRKMYFNPKGATMELLTDSTQSLISENPMMQYLDGSEQYIGDGSTFTSEVVFAEDYSEHFGNDGTSVRLKTIHYANDGAGNIEASKHDEKTLSLPADTMARIKDANGNIIAVFKRIGGVVNIYEPNNVVEGQHIDYLATNDETKIRRGELTKDNIVHTISGKSIGVIQYSDHIIKQESMLTTQISYFIQDAEDSQFLIDKFDTDTTSPSSPRNSINKLIRDQKTSEGIDNLILDFAMKYYDVIPGNVESLADLGAGRFPSQLLYLQEVLKNRSLKTIADNKTSGSYLDFRPDYLNQVKEDEIILPVYGKLVNTIMRSMGKRDSDFISEQDKTSSINEWLSKNNKYVLVSRSPLTSITGLRIYKIKRLDSQIGDSFIVNPKEVKEGHQADHDYDHGHIVLLKDEEVRSFKKITKPLKPIGLNKYKRSEKISNNYELNHVSSVAGNMTYGETAIGEIVNIMRYSSMFNKIFSNGSIPMLMASKESKGELDLKLDIRIRGLNDRIEDPNIETVDGSYFKGTFSDYLQIHLQSALDHPKELLLNEWNYTSKELSKKMFYNASSLNDEIPDQVWNTINNVLIKGILKINSFVDNMVDPQKGRLKWNDVFRYSGNYSSFLDDRAAYIIKEQKSQIIAFAKKNKRNPDVLKAYYKKHAIIDKDSLSVSAGKNPVDISEKITVTFSKILESQGMSADDFYNVTPENSLVAHKKALKNLAGDDPDMNHLFTEEENIARSDKKVDQDALKYAIELQNRLELLTSKQRSSPNLKENSLENMVSSKTWDYNDNFINFYEIWSKKYKSLPHSGAQKLATLKYLKGVGRMNAKTGTISARQSMNMVPPVTRDRDTTLHPEIMEKYFAEYNKEVNQLIRRKIKNRAEFVSQNPKSINTLKEGRCNE